MRFLQDLSLFASIASVVVAQATTPAPSPTASCPAYSCAGGAQGNVASTLSGFQSASAFCSSSYVSRQTCTLRSTSTVRTTVSTVTTTSTVAATTVTVTGTTRTFTSSTTTTPSPTTLTVTTTRTNSATQTSIVTISETTTENANQKRQNSALPQISNSVTGQASVLSSLRASQSSAYIAAVCTCLVKPASATVLVQAITTSRVTATSTARVAFQARTTVYPSTTITVTITAARVTRTATASVTTVATSTTLTSVTATSTATAENLNACTRDAPEDFFEGQCGPTPQGEDVNTCACYTDTAGKGFCADYFGECGPPCAQNSDCTPGQHCLVDPTSDCNPTGFCAAPTDVTMCGTQMTTAPEQKRSYNPMAFKIIARSARLRHTEPAVKPEGFTSGK